MSGMPFEHREYFEMEARAEAAEARISELEAEAADLLNRLEISGALRQEAEARENDLEAALRGLENAVRIFGVMLNEPAAKGLMSADDYATYFRGAWLGVEEAVEFARAALVADRTEEGAA